MNFAACTVAALAVLTISQAEARKCFNASELQTLNSEHTRSEFQYRFDSILDRVSNESQLEEHIQECQPNGTTTTRDALSNLRMLSEFSLVTTSTQSSTLVERLRTENLKILGQCEDLPEVVLTTTEAPATTTRRPCTRCPRPTTPKSKSSEEESTVTPRTTEVTETTEAPSTTPGQTTPPCPPECRNAVCPRCRHCKVSSSTGKAYCAKDDDFYACKRNQFQRGNGKHNGNHGSNGNGNGHGKGKGGH